MLTEAFEALERYAPNRPAIVVAEIRVFRNQTQPQASC